MVDVPKTMRAVVTTGHGGLDKLEYRQDWPVPEPGPGEVLVKVGACGLNNTDINTRAAWYAKEVREGTTSQGGATGFLGKSDGDGEGGWGNSTIAFPRIQGADVCGRVVRVGPGGDEGLLGRRVLIDTWFRDWSDPLNMDKCGYFGSEFDGGYAEFTKAPEKNVCPVESELTDAELATFATSYVTAENMLTRACVAAGDTVLIPGASGGVGSALIQLTLRRGAVPIAMCSPAKADQVRALGAETVIDRAPASLQAALAEQRGSDKVDVVADVVGGPIWPQLIESLCRSGRYTCAGAIAGPIVEFDLRTFYLSDLTFTGATIVPPDMFKTLVRYIERGEVKPLLAATYALSQVREAQEAFMKKDHVGNIVIDMGK